MSTVVDDPDTRRRELAKIHIARDQLQMADDTYRRLLHTIGRVESAADLDHAGRRRLLDHFVACGWKPTGSKTRRVRPSGPTAALVRKVNALLAAMRLAPEYALSLASRQTGRTVSDLAWLSAAELRALVAALSRHQAKHFPETAQRR